MLLSVFGFTQTRTTSTWWARNNRTPTSTYAANYSIVTETGNNSCYYSANWDKHVSEVTQDGLNYGLGGYKTKRLSLSLCENQAVIGSHGDKIWLKLYKR
jgi:hypothetical protein